MPSLDQSNDIREKTEALKVEIEKRIEDLLAQDPECTGLALALVSLGAFAKKHPAELDSKSRQLIKENYPEATDAHIAQRSMSESGVNTAIGTAVKMARIAHDYSPLSNISSEIKSDFALPEEVRSSVEQSLIQAYADATVKGLSPFGTSTMMIMMGVQVGLMKGVSGLKMMRPLLEQMSSPLEKAEIENRKRVVQKISNQMGISKAEAEKYLKNPTD